MAAIYMKHPKHGKKVAIMECEALADEKNGWVRFDPATENAAPVLPEATFSVYKCNPPGRPRKEG